MRTKCPTWHPALFLFKMETLNCIHSTFFPLVTFNLNTITRVNAMATIHSIQCVYGQVDGEM